MDIYSREKRSDIMARVKATDSTPELAVRRVLHSLGYRFRLHRTNLPGKPDIVLPKYKSVILFTDVSGITIRDVRNPNCRNQMQTFGEKRFWITSQGISVPFSN